MAAYLLFDNVEVTDAAALAEYFRRPPRSSPSMAAATSPSMPSPS
jgi:hypothetical protein